MFTSLLKKLKTCTNKPLNTSATQLSFLNCVKKSVIFKSHKQTGLQLLLVLTTSLFAAGCSTIPKDFSTKDQGTFEAKVLIRDLQKKKSYVVNAKAQAQKPDHIRLDITSPIGGHLFSLVNKGENVEYLVVKQKRHVRTSGGAGALKEIIPVSINPSRLLNVFFGNAIDDDNWKCGKANQDLNCTEAATKTEIIWEPVTNGQRRVRINQPGRAAIQISISRFSEDLDLSKNPFELKVPSSFRTYER